MEIFIRKHRHGFFIPSTIQELANILKSCNANKTPVTIRNTGHSANGQTLTNGVQIVLEHMIWTRFDEDVCEVTVGAGTSWNDLKKQLGPNDLLNQGVVEHLDF